MLEIPEAYVLSEQLKNVMVGACVMQVIVNASPHKLTWFFENPDVYGKRLMGHKVTDVVPRAGQVEFQFEEMRLAVSDGVNIRLFTKGEKIPMKHQLMIEFDNDKILVFTVQMYGGLMAFEAGENQNPYYLVTTMKPSPLTDAFDEAYFTNLLNGEKQTLSLKAFLATEQRIPGLGNGALQDILYNAGLHPKKKLSTLSTDEINALYQSVKTTLKAMTDQGGRNTEKDLFGNVCGYKTRLCSMTHSEPCHKCGDIIHKESYLGGSIYYCATCQPL